MIIKVMRVDKQGFFIEDVLIKEGQAVPVDCVANKVPEGLHLPKWDGMSWVEGKAIDLVKELQKVKETKVLELYSACEQEILRGFNSSCRGTVEWFTNSRDDQNRVISQASIVTINPKYVPEWKSASEHICTPFTMAQIIQLATDGALFMTERIKVFEALKNQVKSALTAKEVNSILWINKVW